MYNGKKKIEENTEYSIRMPDGKVQKFAYYGEKENGRLILLNTKYGTLTSMGAAYFMKLISGKYPCTKRPYNVEYPEDYKAHKAPSTDEVTDKKLEENLRVEERKQEEALHSVDENIRKWIVRLKTLPDHESEILEKELKISPRKLAEDYERVFFKDEDMRYFDGYGILTNTFTKATNLLEGTEWDVK